MSTLDEVGERDGWRCWVCDEPVDPDRSVNDRPRSQHRRRRDRRRARSRHRAPSGSRTAPATPARARSRRSSPGRTGLYVVEPAPLIGVAERLTRKGGREVVARCPTRTDAQEAADWLVDRLSRLAPDLRVAADVEPGGGQFLLVLRTA